MRRRRRRHSARDTRLDKKALWKGLNADIRTRDRRKIADLRAAIRATRARRSELLRAAKNGCRQGRVDAMLLAREIQARAAEEARAVRQAARSACLGTRSEAANARAEIVRLRAELEAERKHQRELRAIARSERSRRGEKLRPLARTRAAERQGESDDEVRQNIPSELVPMFNRVRRSIRGGARMSRTEAFLHYAEEHPSEQYAGIDDKTDELVRELERQARAGRRDPRRRRRRH